MTKKTESHQKPNSDHSLVGSTILLENGAKVTVRRRIGLKDETIGLSFEAEWTTDAPHEVIPRPVSRQKEEESQERQEIERLFKAKMKVFLKLPDPHEKLSTGELDRFRRENEKGDLLRFVAFRCNKNKDTSPHFSIPRFLCFSQISSIEGGGDGDHEGYTGLPVLVYEYIPDTTPLDRLTPNDLIIKDPSTLLDFAVGLTRLVQRLHNQGILHSYIVPRHILTPTKAGGDYFLGGFGYSALCVHEPGVADPPRQDESYRAPELRDLHGLDALWLPADLFSIGAILFRRATGQDPELYRDGRFKEELKYVSNLKEYVFSSIQARNRALFRGNENILKIIDMCLRYKPDDRYFCAEELLDGIEVARMREADFSVRSKPDENYWKATLSESPGISSPFPNAPWFRVMVKKSRSDAESLAEHISRCHIEVYGDHDVIVTALCRMLGSLNKGDSYHTITLPSYWTDRNLGSNGRFLTMNKALCRRGVKIQRVFLVSGPFHTLSEEEQNVLRDQEKAIRTLQDENALSKLQVKVATVSESLITGFEREGHSVAFVVRTPIDSKTLKESKAPDTGTCLSLNFVSQGTFRTRYGKNVIERQIRKVRFWDPTNYRPFWERFVKGCESFHERFENPNAEKLSRYIKGDENASLLHDVLDHYLPHGNRIPSNLKKSGS